MGERQRRLVVVALLAASPHRLLELLVGALEVVGVLPPHVQDRVRPLRTPAATMRGEHLRRQLDLRAREAATAQEAAVGLLEQRRRHQLRRCVRVTVEQLDRPLRAPPGEVEVVGRDERQSQVDLGRQTRLVGRLEGRQAGMPRPARPVLVEVDERQQQQRPHPNGTRRGFRRQRLEQCARSGRVGGVEERLGGRERTALPPDPIRRRRQPHRLQEERRSSGGGAPRPHVLARPLDDGGGLLRRRVRGERQLPGPLLLDLDQLRHAPVQPPSPLGRRRSHDRGAVEGMREPQSFSRDLQETRPLGLLEPRRGTRSHSGGNQRPRRLCDGGRRQQYVPRCRRQPRHPPAHQRPQIGRYRQGIARTKIVGRQLPRDL